MNIKPILGSKFQRLRFRINLLRSKLFRLNRKTGLLLTALGFMIALLAYPTPEPLIHNNYSQIVLDENGVLLRAFLNENQQWCFPPDETTPIPDKLKEAVIAFEDARFYWHFGVDIPAVIRASKQNIRQKRVISGASTLTMQVARMHLKGSRTFSNKLKEMLLAIRIEAHYSKREILELYLNHAPFGGNIEGYTAASMRYFRKQPKELSWAQAAMLAVLPNSPALVSPGKNQNKLKIKRDALLLKLKENKTIDDATYQSSLQEPLPDRVFPFKIVAPHLTQRIHVELTGKRIKTSINLELQTKLERMLAQYAAQLRQRGIGSASALVVENQSGLVKAYVGSPNFFDTYYQGQVDGVMAARSSGSILKPFLYALSMDEGLAVPSTIIFDIPTYYDAFSPNNADEKFTGLVRAREALVSSLNVPAVRLLNAYGVYSFYQFLKEGGITSLFRTPDEYGLPIILGGAETSPWDVAKLYRGLANRGSFSEISYLKADSATLAQQCKPLISAGAAFLTLDMLRELKRPDSEFFWEQYHNQVPVAWKTGTSYGHKDAWAAGSTPQYTVVVWAGNFDGQSNTALAGTTIAGPLMFDIFKALPQAKGHQSGWFSPKETDLKTIELCSETGFVAGAHCKNVRYEKVPIHMRPLKVCPYHIQIETNTNETEEVCSRCWVTGHHSKVVLSYPPEVVFQLKKRGIETLNKPNHTPQCPAMHHDRAIEFIYPKDSTLIWLPRDFDGTHQPIVVKLAHRQQQSVVYWYMDRNFLGTTNQPHQMTLKPEQGWHQLYVTDQEGNRRYTNFFVGKRN